MRWIFLVAVVAACVVPDSRSEVSVTVTDNKGPVILVLPEAPRPVRVDTRWVTVPIPVSVPLVLPAPECRVPVTAEAAP